MLPRKRLLLFNQRDPRILLHDPFDGSAANTNLVTLTDSENKITVSGGLLRFAGGLATPAWGEPSVVYKHPYNRVPGLILEWQVTPAATNTYFLLGFTDGTLDSANAYEAHSLYFTNIGTIWAVTQTGSVLTPATYSAASMWLKWEVRASGALYSISTDNRVTYSPVWLDTSVTTTPLYPFIESYNAALTSSDVYVSQRSITPPAVTDTFTRANSTTTLGSAETGQAWTADAGTWGISSNKAYSVTANNGDFATLDGQKVNGIFDVAIVNSNYTNKQPGFIFRGIDTSNFLLVHQSSALLYLYKYDSASFTSLASVDNVPVDSTSYAWRVVCIGNAIGVYVDNVLKISHTLTGGDATKFNAAGCTRVGFRMGSSGAATLTWDDLSVYG